MALDFKLLEKAYFYFDKPVPYKLNNEKNVLIKLEQWLMNFIKCDVNELNDYKKGYYRMAEMVLDEIKYLKERGD